MSSPNRKGKSEQEIAKVDKGDLIEIVNQLRNTLAASGKILDVSLPQIVAVGCQSAGKSSVLENIVGKEFLPRGTGVVTRRPTVVQLEPCEDEYVTFSHKPGEIFRDFQLVKEEIANETNKDPGPIGFSKTAISLKIYSPKVLKLTLVDLPGLIKVIVEEQSESSIQEVRNMILDYIKQPNSLILAVSPANQDIANSDAMEIAKTVDPEGIRTIGVLTKLDLMDDGTNARDILENKKIPLKRGYVGVLNRSQKEIEEGKDIDYCLEKEQHFFKSMPCYSHMADRMGTPYLIKTLHHQLHEHIRESLPAVREELSKNLAQFRKELKEFNDLYGRNSSQPVSTQFYVITLVENFVERYVAEIYGQSIKVNINKFSAGAMINYKLHRDIKNGLKLPEVPDKRKLLTIFANLHGVRNSFSMPFLSLETVMNQLLTEYIEPLNNFVDSTANILLSNIQESTIGMKSYPTLKNKVLYLIRKSIEESAFSTKEYLQKHMEAEMYFINTYDKDFNFAEETLSAMKLWNYGAMNQPKENVCDDSNGLKSGDKEALEILVSNEHVTKNANLLSEIIEKSISIQQKHIEDIAMKYILFFLVKNVMDFVKIGLLPTILECANTDIIFMECEKDFNKIAEIESTCNCLEEALVAVQTF